MSTLDMGSLDAGSTAQLVFFLDPARLDSWLQDYSLGQLWEKNELGGRPRVE